MVDQYVEEKGTKYQNHYLVMTKKGENGWVRNNLKKEAKPNEEQVISNIEEFTKDVEW